MDSLLIYCIVIWRRVEFLSFIHEVKEEISRYWPNKKCCQRAELTALLHIDGSLHLRAEGKRSFTTESSEAYTARKIYTLIHEIYDLRTSVIKAKRSTPRKGNTYIIEISEQPALSQFLNELGILDQALMPDPVISGRFTRSPCCVSAVLRGAFLGGGYVSNPRNNTDFEIVISSEAAALRIKELMEQKDIYPRLRKRRGSFVLYLKNREGVARFLAVTGAYSAHLKWQSQVVINQVRNQVNRMVNCDTANARRTAEASSRQRKAIKALKERGYLSSLSDDLLRVAQARMENPQAALSELAEIMGSELTRSVVNSGLRRLERIAYGK